MEKIDQSSNYIKYSSKNFLQQYLIKRFLRSVSAHLHGVGYRSLLDVGCGEGFVLETIKKDFRQRKIVGVDVNSKALKVAKEKLSEVRFIKADICNLPFEENSFDMIICLEVVEHVTDYHKALNEIKRVSGKYILLSVPWEPLFSWANMLRGKNMSRFGRDPEHTNFWTKNSFNKLLKKHGLNVISHKVIFPWQLVLIKEGAS